MAILGLSVLSSQATLAQDSTELARQATDPTASLMSFNFIADYGDDYEAVPGQNDHTLDLTFRPVIPFHAFGVANILRLTVPFRAGGRGANGLGTVSVFDLAIFEEDWGRWAVGGVAALSRQGAADDEFTIGPALGAVWNYRPYMQLGLFSQNLLGSDTAITQLQPIVNYQMGNGWSLTAGDLQWIYDFENSEFLSFPIGFQLGKVTTLFGQPVRYAINPQWNLVDDENTAGWSLVFTFTILAPAG